MVGPERDTDRPLAVEASIDFVLNHPDMSCWLKKALATAVDRDPSAVLNDLEVLNVVFRAKAAVQVSTQGGDA